MKLDHFDVVILGGGPAGSAMAIELARRGQSVALLERSEFEVPRIGEMLPPEASRQLKALGVWEAFERSGHSPSPGIVFAWSMPTPEENDFIFNPYGNGWHLDRQCFDAMLAQAAEEAGATVLRGSRVTDCQRQPNEPSWHVQAVCHGQVREFACSVVVDATGRSAWLARRQGVRKMTCDQLVGVVATLRNAVRRDERLLLEAFSRGWWYSGLLPNGRAIAVCMTDADFLPHGREALRDFWADCLREAPLTLEAIGVPEFASELQTVSANTARLEAVSGPGWIAVGDAAVSYDPLSSRGISKALESAVSAAKVVSDWLVDRRDGFVGYGEWREADFASYRQQAAAYYRQVERWPDSAFWRRRQADSEIGPP